MSTDHVRENWLWDAIYDAWQQTPMPEGVDQASANEVVDQIEVKVSEIADRIVPYIYWRGACDALEKLALEVGNYMGLDYRIAKHYVVACEEWKALGLPGGDLHLKTPDYEGQGDGE